MNNDQAFSGLKNLYQNYQLEKVGEKKVFLIGIGGVGSWCAEALVRSGIKKIALMDLDDICISNTNRQIHTNLNSIGQLKTEVMKKRLEEIASDVEVEVIHNFLTADNVDKLGLENSDIIIDAFDSLDGKAALIAHCLKKGKKMITCGAAGGKTEAIKVTTSSLTQSENDMLLKRLKRKLRTKYQIVDELRKIKAVYSSQKALEPITCEETKDLSLNCQGSLGSSVMVTATMGLLAAQLAFEEVIS
jgi:tRNA A37 threonylcarbamoyladenosine dehydratase